MKTPPRVSFLIMVALVILLLILGAWWFYRTGNAPLGFSQTPAVLVTITSPINGDEINAGDFITVTGQAVAVDSIQILELFMDGQSMGFTGSTLASWTWQAWPLGVHSFYIKATAINGLVGYSQVVIVNVLAGDGIVNAFAPGGQTLEQIGAGYGVPSDQIAGANPGLDPVQPLPGGKQVQVPIINKDPPTVPAGGGSLKLIPVKWKIKITEPVDKSYCYVSGGKGVWEKIPKDPFNFFFGQENFYVQLIPYASKLDIKAQCWGWAGGVLKYLGQGETFLDAVQPTGPVMINADHFEFSGDPQLPKDSGGPTGTVTPPYALREPGNSSECSSHGNPLLAPLICDTLLNAKTKEYRVLIWEWKPEVCWTGYCKYEINEIDGYMIYELDGASPSSSYFLKEIDNPNQKVTAIPLSWSAKCYGVTALSKGQESEMATYCPGLESGVEKITLKIVQSWVTSDDALFTSCSTVNIPRLGILPKGFGSSTGQVLVGADKFEEGSGSPLAGYDCYSDAYFNAGIKFQFSPALPDKSIVQKAILRFSVPFQGYDDGLTKSNQPLSGGTCVSSVFRAKNDWSGLVDEDHWTNGFIMDYADYGGPISSVLQGGSPQADVTAIVKGWAADPSGNNGLILTPDGHPTYFYDGLLYCYTGLSNFTLDVYYIAPP